LGRIADLHRKKPLIGALAPNNFVVDRGSSLVKCGHSKLCLDEQNRQSEKTFGKRHKRQPDIFKERG
jgi:hypothetical protein